jgi:hypothetical protein
MANSVNILKLEMGYKNCNIQSKSRHSKEFKGIHGWPSPNRRTLSILDHCRFKAERTVLLRKALQNKRRRDMALKIKR